MNRYAILLLCFAMGRLAGQPATGRLTGDLRSDDGQPVAGEVMVVTPGAGVRMNVFRTDGQGAFTLVAPAGRVVVVARADDHISVEREITVRPGAANPTLHFTLAPAGTVSGRVYDEQGAAVPGARVWVSYRGGQRTWQFADEGGPVDADAFGYFSLPLVARGRPFLLHVESEDRLPSTSGPFTMRSAGMPGAVLMAGRRGGSVGGKVTDSAGLPVGGALVRLRVLPDEGEFPAEQKQSMAFLKSTHKTMRSAPDGSYLFAGVPSGRTVVTAQDGNRRAGAEVRVQSGAAVDLTLELR
jgi:hypothetical protein